MYTEHFGIIYWNKPMPLRLLLSTGLAKKNKCIILTPLSWIETKDCESEQHELERRGASFVFWCSWWLEFHPLCLMLIPLGFLSLPEVYFFKWNLMLPLIDMKLCDSVISESSDGIRHYPTAPDSSSCLTAWRLHFRFCELMRPS